MRCKRQSSIKKSILYDKGAFLLSNKSVLKITSWLDLSGLFSRRELGTQALDQACADDSTMPTFCTVCRLDSQSFCEVLSTS